MRSALRFAQALAKARNFHRAAAALGMSQSQLSRKIKALEEELGVVIFERNRSGVVITPIGGQVLREAAALIKADDAFIERVAAIRSGTAGELKLGVGAFASQSWVATAFADMAVSHPTHAISMRELDWWKLLDAVLGGEFHMVIGECSDAEQNPDVVVDRLPEREAGIFVRTGHPLSGRERVTIEEIARFPLAAPRLPGRVGQFLPAASKLGSLSDDGRYFLPIIESATPRSMIDVVLASSAVCIMLPQLCADQLASGTMIELPFHPPWLRVRQGIMYRRGKPLSDAALTFRATAMVAERKYFGDEIGAKVASTK